MVGINTNASNADNFVSINLAAPIDSVGRLDIVTSSSRFFTRFNTGTATLVAPNKILTAAHVIDPDLDGIADIEDLSQYSFKLGDNVDIPDRTIGISQVSLHPAWVDAEQNRFNVVDEQEFENPLYDLAVLTLSEDITDIPSIPIAPNVTEFADNTALLGQTGTLIGYGNTSNINSPSALIPNNGTRRAAENIIDSIDNGLIRFDYDSTFEFQQEPDTGINSPSFDGSTPQVIPVPSSSPIPIPLEGEIGEGDSGGPLLVQSDLGAPVVVGVASQLIDPDAITRAIPGYGSVDVYAALSRPSTLEFLAEEGLYDPTPENFASQTLNSQVTVDDFDFSLNNYSGARTRSEFTESYDYLEQPDIFYSQSNYLNLVSTAEI